MKNCIDWPHHTSHNCHLTILVQFTYTITGHPFEIPHTHSICTTSNSTIYPIKYAYSGLHVKDCPLAQDRWNSLQWHHNGGNGVSNHQPHDYLLNRLFRRRSKKTSKLRFTGLCAGNSPVTGEFSAQMASNVKNVSIWWLHQVLKIMPTNIRAWCWGLSTCPGQVKICLRTGRHTMVSVHWDMWKTSIWLC